MIPVDVSEVIKSNRPLETYRTSWGSRFYGLNHERIYIMFSAEIFEPSMPDGVIEAAFEVLRDVYGEHYNKLKSAHDAATKRRYFTGSIKPFFKAELTYDIHNQMKMEFMMSIGNLKIELSNTGWYSTEDVSNVEPGAGSFCKVYTIGPCASNTLVTESISRTSRALSMDDAVEFILTFLNEGKDAS